MRYNYSSDLRDDVHSRVLATLKATGIINITVVAEEIRRRNIAENVAREDIEHLVLQVAELYGAAVEFDELSSIGVFKMPCAVVQNGHGIANGHDRAPPEDPAGDFVPKIKLSRLNS